MTEMEEIGEKEEDIGLQNRESTEGEWEIETILGIVLVWRRGTEHYPLSSRVRKREKDNRKEESKHEKIALLFDKPDPCFWGCHRDDIRNKPIVSPWFDFISLFSNFRSRVMKSCYYYNYRQWLAECK